MIQDAHCAEQWGVPIDPLPLPLCGERHHGAVFGVLPLGKSIHKQPARNGLEVLTSV